MFVPIFFAFAAFFFKAGGVLFLAKDARFLPHGEVIEF